MKTTINTNTNKQGIELFFEGMPYGKTRAILKVNGFKWHHLKGCWYAKDTAARRKVAIQVAKREENHVITMETVTDQTMDVDAVLSEVEATPDLDNVMQEAAKEPITVYRYGMKRRGFSIGCQPMDGFIERYDDDESKYFDIITYNRPLKDYETSHFDLDFLGSETETEAEADHIDHEDIEPENTPETTPETTPEVVEPETPHVNSLGVVIVPKEKKPRKSPIQKVYDDIQKTGSQMKFWNGSHEGKFYGCDGYRLMITTETIECEGIEKEAVDRMENMIKALDLDKEYKLDFTAKELKEATAQLKDGKRTAKVVYCFEDGGLVINAKYLLDAMIATGSDTVKYSTGKSPVLMNGDHTEFMICPINNDSLNRGLHVIA